MRCGLIKVNRSVSMTTGVHGMRKGMKISVFSCWWRKDSVWVWKCNWNISLGCQWNRSIWLLRFLCEDVGFLLLVAIATLAAMSRLQVMPCLRFFFFFLNRHMCFPLIHYFRPNKKLQTLKLLSIVTILSIADCLLMPDAGQYCCMLLQCINLSMSHK